jgi:hypothetical protein
MWYSKFNLRTREGNIVCPSCHLKNEEQFLYTLDQLPCTHCASPNVFIRTTSFIYVFAIAAAPPLFKTIYKELRSKSLTDAYSELLEIVSVFKDEHQYD